MPQTWEGCGQAVLRTSDGRKACQLALLWIICLCSIVLLIGTLRHKDFVQRGRGGGGTDSSCGPAEELYTGPQISDICVSSALTFPQPFPGQGGVLPRMQAYVTTPCMIKDIPGWPNNKSTVSWRKFKRGEGQEEL
jgi:hypothetical protein